SGHFLPGAGSTVASVARLTFSIFPFRDEGRARQRRAKERRVAIGNKPRRNSFDVIAEPPLVFEAVAELRTQKEALDLSGDAAGDEHAAARAMRQSEIARHRTEDGAKHVERPGAIRVARAGALHYLGR